MIELQNTYAELGAEFSASVPPTSASAPELLFFNAELAASLGLGLEGKTDAELAALCSGKTVWPGSQPLAMVYAGHQFGNFSPQLGDGRAVLLGEVVRADGQRFDVQVKGSGPTPFSRGGDGLAWVGPVLREYIVSEAMHRFGVPTTRALAAVTTGGVVHRQGAFPGAAVTRVASSHIRVGTFEFFASRGRHDGLRKLADYAIARHYPELNGPELNGPELNGAGAAEDPDRYIRFFEAVVRRTLSLVARWKSLGFVHGVMNTDNVSISGETIDFGPCAFQDTFRFDKVFSSIDRQGRYRYENQESIALWNLAVLANCLVPIAGPDADAAVEKLGPIIADARGWFDAEWLSVMAPKFGITSPRPEDAELVESYLRWLEAERLDFTIAFRALADEMDGETPFHMRWRARLKEQALPDEEVRALMLGANPAIIPRNHQIERAIQDALVGDLTHARRLHEALARPFDDVPEFAEFKAAPKDAEVVTATFCGT